MDGWVGGWVSFQCTRVWTGMMIFYEDLSPLFLLFPPLLCFQPRQQPQTTNKHTYLCPKVSQRQERRPGGQHALLLLEGGHQGRPHESLAGCRDEPPLLCLDADGRQGHLPELTQCHSCAERERGSVCVCVLCGVWVG